MRNRPLESIKKAADFKKVYKQGKAASNKHFAVYAETTDRGYARLGLSIGKKVGKAVVRNKLRRWIKEFCRLNKELLPSADIVVVAKAMARELVAAGMYSKTEKSLSKLTGQLK